MDKEERKREKTEQESGQARTGKSPAVNQQIQPTWHCNRNVLR